MTASRVPQVGEVWQWRLPPARFRERSRVRIDAIGDDSVAFTYLRSGCTNGSTLLGFLRVYDFIEAAPDEAVSA